MLISKSSSLSLLLLSSHCGHCIIKYHRYVNSFHYHHLQYLFSLSPSLLHTFSLTLQLRQAKFIPSHLAKIINTLSLSLSHLNQPLSRCYKSNNCNASSETQNRFTTTTPIVFTPIINKRVFKCGLHWGLSLPVTIKQMKVS